MTTQKSVKIKTVSKSVSPDVETKSTGNIINNLLSFSGKFTKFKFDKRAYLILIVIGILLLALYNKSLFIAATINGMPLTNLELQMKLNDQFRTQMLNQLVNEKIIMNEAAKNSAVPSQQEVDQKIADLEETVGGKDALNSLLAQQGQNRNQLRDQIMVQLAITKLYTKDATVSADEVTKFIDTNKAQLQASDSAGQEKEATDTLTQQKLSQIFSQKFQELRQKANIKIF